MTNNLYNFILQVEVCSIFFYKMAFQMKYNKELEDLRNETDGPPNLDILLIKIQKLTSKIHTSFLFNDNHGFSLLQQLCLYLSSSKSGKTYNSWIEFAGQLGLNREQVQCIDYNFKGIQDPTYYVLLTFVQLPDSTLDKVIIALRNISRFDIINRLIEPLNQLLDNLSITTSTQEVIKWNLIPRVPFVLKQIIKTETLSTISTADCDDKATVNAINNKNYGSIVMLTFRNDGEKVVNSITKIFRNKMPKIGVLILKEQEKYVYSKSVEFVDDCFKQVDYIIPILTNDYVNHLNNHESISDDDNSLDGKYVKYIYSLMKYEYIRNHCTNNRIRCIIPDNDINHVIKSDLHPIFQAWFKQSDIETFADNILLKKF